MRADCCVCSSSCAFTWQGSPPSTFDAAAALCDSGACLFFCVDHHGTECCVITCKCWLVFLAYLILGHLGAERDELEIVWILIPIGMTNLDSQSPYYLLVPTSQGVQLPNTMVTDDAWSATFRPPQNESPEERQARIARQHEATRISREIDDAIEKSRKQFEKRKKAIKVLLLGQSLFPVSSSAHPLSGQAESGKSTMLRSMSNTLHCLPHAHSAQTFSSPFVQPTFIARFRYGKSSYSSTSSGASSDVPPSLSLSSPQLRQEAVSHYRRRTR